MSRIRTIASNLPRGLDVQVQIRAMRGRFHFEGFALSKDVLPEAVPAPRARTIHTEDPNSGCPGVIAADTPLFTQSFTMTRGGFISSRGDLIRSYSGRADLYLYVDGNLEDRTLTYTPSLQWEDAHVTWSGFLAAGNHDIWLESNRANAWGCGTGWGSIDTIIFE
jgi:hypothetical protein